MDVGDVWEIWSGVATVRLGTFCAFLIDETPKVPKVRLQVRSVELVGVIDGWGCHHRDGGRASRGVESGRRCLRIEKGHVTLYPCAVKGIGKDQPATRSLNFCISHLRTALNRTDTTCIIETIVQYYTRGTAPERKQEGPFAGVKLL